jgi:23S rRNA pseudouridine1911/1915/1917 synthase
VRAGWTVSRRTANQLISSGRVHVNGRRYRKGESIAAGDKVDVIETVAADGIAPNPDLKIEILLEHAQVIVANKPALMPCHPLRADERDTVMNAIVAAYPETARAGDKPQEGGLVHRLDNGTSGALIIARNADAFVALREALRDGRVTRRYQALVAGRVTGTIEIATPIAHHAKNARKMVVVETHARTIDTGVAKVNVRYRSNPRPAFTKIEPLSYQNGFTLVRATPRTGSRHQIRVHLASIGYPIAGDELYGGPPLAELVARRFWLHLAELEFEAPAGGRVEAVAPLANDLEDSLARLRSKSVNAEAEGSQP